MNAEEYGWANPAPGTRLWRLRTYPETLSDEDARLVAQDLLAHIDALAAKVEGLPRTTVDDPGLDISFGDQRAKIPASHSVLIDRAAVLAILRGEA